MNTLFRGIQVYVYWAAHILNKNVFNNNKTEDLSCKLGSKEMVGKRQMFCRIK